MAPDDDRDEPAAFGAPLPPDDRLWRHPSELAGSPDHTQRTAAPAARGASSRWWHSPRARTATAVGAALLTGLAVSAIAFTVVAATGQSDQTGATARVRDAATATPVSLAVGSATAAVLPSLVHLTTVDDHGTGSASALVLRRDGYLLTTTGAVAGATHITATIADGRTLPATLVGVDPATRVAVLRVPATDLKPAPLGRTEPVQVGDPTLSVGATTGATPRLLSEAVVQARGRTVSLPGGNLADVIVTSRPLPAGTDGAAMVDSSGEVTGLCVGTESTAPTGYAVPIGLATHAADQLIATGHATHASLGATGEDLPTATADRLGVRGVELRVVQPGGSAAKAGLQPGDIVLSLDRQPVPTTAQLAAVILTHRPGQRVAVEYLHGPRHLMTTLVLGGS